MDTKNTILIKFKGSKLNALNLRHTEKSIRLAKDAEKDVSFILNTALQYDSANAVPFFVQKIENLITTYSNLFNAYFDKTMFNVLTNSDRRKFEKKIELLTNFKYIYQSLNNRKIEIKISHFSVGGTYNYFKLFNILNRPKIEFVNDTENKFNLTLKSRFENKIK